MNYTTMGAGPRAFSYENLHDAVKACIWFYHSSLMNENMLSDAYERRRELSGWIRKFHSDCDTLTHRVEESIEKLRANPCLFLMTAHQPNLFAYGGVLRKAALNHVLADQLSGILSLPVVSFFGIADQDFTDDPWVRSALLPDANRRGGSLELRFNMPERLMLNRIKLPRGTLSEWQKDVQSWFDSKLASIVRTSSSLRFNVKTDEIAKNLRDFWNIVEDAYAKATTYSDFNAFLISRVVNQIWGYDTLFSRFSECQQIFENEFCFLLSHFEEYSRHVAETGSVAKARDKAVQEHEAIPFWYHCDCGSKARLKARLQDGFLSGYGECLRCGKTYDVDFHSTKDPSVSGILTRMSARALSMPLVFFDGLKICCYVGGVAGIEYLRNAQYVAQKMGKSFPPIVVWRPRDVYLGLGQLDALIAFKRLSGTFDVTKYSTVMAQLRERISTVKKEIEEFEAHGTSLVTSGGGKEDDKIERVKVISRRKRRIIEEADLPLLTRNLKLLQNMEGIRHAYPCMVDYALNVGLRSVSEQWIAFLKEGGRFASNVILRTELDGLLQSIGSGAHEEWARWAKA